MAKPDVPNRTELDDAYTADRRFLAGIDGEVAASGRMRGAIYALGGAGLMVAAVFGSVVHPATRGLSIMVLGFPGTVLFLSGGFTATFGPGADEREGLGWSVLRIGFGVLSFLLLGVGVIIVVGLVRR